MKKTWSDVEFGRGRDLREPRRGRWLLLTVAAAVALILYQFPAVGAAISRTCSRGRGQTQSDEFVTRWEEFDWEAVSGVVDVVFSLVPWDSGFVQVPVPASGSPSWIHHTMPGDMRLSRYIEHIVNLPFPALRCRGTLHVECCDTPSHVPFSSWRPSDNLFHATPSLTNV